VGQKVDLEFNLETLKISDLPEDEQESHNGAGRGASSIIENIKRKTEVQREESNDSKSGWERAEPKEGFSLDKPKVRAQVESTKLREILNKIGTDEDSPF